MKNLEEKKSLNDFTDRELLELLLVNQLKLHRKISYIEANLYPDQNRPAIGTFEKSFKDMTGEASHILTAMNKFLSDQDKEY